MQGIITFKGKEKGLEIYLDERSTYPVLREELMEKLKKNQDFFRDSETRVIIRGKKLSEAQRKELAGVEKTLGNPGFVAKAAPEVVAAKRERSSKLAEEIAVLEAQIRDLA